jgi:signal transduction histidine kinase
MMLKATLKLEKFLLKQFIVLALLLFLLVTKTYSQILIDTISESKYFDRNITSQVLYYPDKNELKPEQLRKLSVELWHWVDSRAFIGKAPKTAYWFSFDLKAIHSSNRNLFIRLSNKGINKVVLFSYENDKLIKSDTAGDAFEFKKRPYPSTHFIFPVYLTKDVKHSYLLYCDKKDENLNLEIHLENENRLNQQEYNLYFYIGLFAGFLILGFLTSITLFFILNNKLHFWYAIYILSAINFLFAYESLDFKWFYPFCPFYSAISRYNASSISLALIIYVMQLFCDQNRSNSIFYRTANIIKYIIISHLFISFIVFYYFPDSELKKIYFFFFIIMQLSGILITLASSMEKVIQGYKPALFYFSAVFILLCSGILAVFSEISFVNIQKETPNLLQLGFIIEVALISIGILYKYYLIRKEYKTIQNELQELKLNSMKALLNVQYTERRRIAEDIHDVLGSHLAAIKININKVVCETEDKDKLIESINHLSSTTREIAHNLIPVEIVKNELVQLIHQHISTINQHQSIKFKFTSIGLPPSLSKSLEYTLYKIILELTNNILQHACATEATIQLLFNNNGGLQILAEDNGVGINLKNKQGMGLPSISKKIKELHGEFVIDSQIGNTTIIINIPKVS